MSITELNHRQLYTEKESRLLLDPATIWHRTAPASIRRAYRRGEEDDGWRMWVDHLKDRLAEQPARRRRARQICPVQWGAGQDGQTPGLFPLPPEQRAPDDPRLETEVADFLDTAPPQQLSGDEALSAVGWARAMPALAAALPAKLWWALLERLLVLREQAAAISPVRKPLVHQLLAGEVGWTLGWRLPELVPCRSLLLPARRALSRGLVELLDGQGMPQARYLEVVDALAACWTRCAAMARQAGKECFSASARVQFEWFVRQLLLLSRTDGSRVFGNGASTQATRQLLAAALELGGDREDRRIAERFLARWPKSPRRGTRRSKPRKLPKASSCSEWAALAVLAPAWSAAAPRLTAAWPGSVVRLEMSFGGELLWSGVWATEVRLDGRSLSPVEPWGQTCWVSDRDVDYLELRQDLENDVCIERHLLMARDDGIMLLADAVLAGRPGRIEYRCTVPLASEAAFRPARESCEGVVQTRTRRALVLPLALPEWRKECNGQHLSVGPEGLELGLAGEGRALFAPLWFDLDAKRNRRQRTWRRLTVGQQRRVVPQDVAVGYRAQVGEQQWLIYRALGGRGSRTLLGHHLRSEFMVGRFQSNGQVEKLLEIE